MTAGEFLADVRRLGVEVWVEGRRLRYRAPKGRLTPALRAELAERKTDLLSLLLDDKIAGGSPPPLRRISRIGEIPLSFAQQRLWFLDQLQPGNSIYNESRASRIRGPLDLAAANETLSEIVRRHEVLRTTFETVGDHPVQVIASSFTLTLPVVDLGQFPESERESEARRLATREAQRPFDLRRGPLLRVTLLRLGKEDHVLVITAHHIVCDGWSMGVFFREVVSLYQAFSNGHASPLSELPIQYADFAMWQRQWLKGEAVEAQLVYWRKQLREAPPLLGFFTDRPRPAVQTFHGATRSFGLSSSLGESLEALSLNEGCTVFMTLLGAFKALLYRYTGQQDLIVGSPIAGRTRTEIEELIGFFVNTLVLRTDLSGDPSFRELLNRLREVCSGAYANQEVPFERLVEELRPVRDLSRAPLFQVMFVMHNAPLPTPEVPDLELGLFRVDSGTAKFDLTLSMTDTGEGLWGELEYNTDLFEEATIRRLAEHFRRILEAVVADPGQRLSALPLLTAGERQQILLEWNQTAAEYPQTACFHELFEMQAAATPEAVAVVYEDQRLTYGELNARANQVAHHLRRRGTDPEVRVGVCLEPSLDMVVALLGILKAGGAYVPLDPGHPSERLAFMLADTQAQALITQPQLLERLSPQEAPVICLNADWEAIGWESRENPSTGTIPDNLAYVIYTSGSTGTPKGVPVSHRGLCNVSQNQIRVFGLKPGHRVLQFASLSFDASVFEITMALGAGATLCLGTRESLLPGSSLMQLLQVLEITVVTLPPSALAPLSAPELPVLQTVTVAGEACSADVVSLWAPGRRFFNLYGPTETTIWATAAQCIDAGPEPVIGRPIGNTQIYLLDAHLQPVPIGVPGELSIGGIGLARGYLNRSETTGEKFGPNPFSNTPGERLYQSGDLARYRSDGNLEFRGRIDQQVKIRGFRIEPGEVEAVLGRYPGVEDALVLAREHTPGDKRLVAYVVPHRERVPRTPELRRFLKATLPDYMVPSAFVLLDALPLTPNGKIDRRLMPAPEPAPEAGYVAPRTPTEEKVAWIWGELLGLERVGVDDNFFELGGHSLLATQVILRLQETFLVELPLLRLLEDPTVAGLAQAIDIARRAGLSTVNIPSTVMDLNTEASLDPAIYPAAVTAESVTGIDHILLTGSTGFLGAFLLYELLQQTHADVYCLVRSPNPVAGRKRIQRNLELSLLSNACPSSRIIPVVGDLSQPLLGLSSEQFLMMASKIDVICHNGAWVNFVHPYGALKATNVLGTQEILRLATQGKVKPVHFISSLSVFSQANHAGEVVCEGDNPDHAEGLSSAYAQSKWAAEKLVASARSRGLPVCIYRPGRITGHSQTGVCHTNDLVYRTIKGFIELGSAPDIDMMVDMTPVDYVSRAIVHLSMQKDSLGKTFHLVNPSPIHASKLADRIRSFGYPLRLVPYEVWRTELIDLAKRSREHAWSPLPLSEGISEEQMLDHARTLRVDCQATRHALANTSIVCPPVDDLLLDTYFSYLIHSGFLKAVRSGPTGINTKI